MIWGGRDEEGGAGKEEEQGRERIWVTINQRTCVRRQEQVKVEAIFGGPHTHSHTSAGAKKGPGSHIKIAAIKVSPNRM